MRVLDVETSNKAEPSFTVIVPRSRIEGCVHLNHIKVDDENSIQDEAKHIISYKNDEMQVFEKVCVKIWVKKIHNAQKELMMI